jgi:uncharacterized protein YbaR (Trm112 family)
MLYRILLWQPLPELAGMLACPGCRARVQIGEDVVPCQSCGARYAVKDGVPIVLVEMAVCRGDQACLALEEVPAEK